MKIKKFEFFVTGIHPKTGKRESKYFSQHKHSSAIAYKVGLIKAGYTNVVMHEEDLPKPTK